MLNKIKEAMQYAHENLVEIDGVDEPTENALAELETIQRDYVLIKIADVKEHKKCIGYGKQAERITLANLRATKANHVLLIAAIKEHKGIKDD